MDLEPAARDLLFHIYEADRQWAHGGHGPRNFLLLHTGGMQRAMDHPGWDDSWPVPSSQTVDDLDELGFLRVEPASGLNRSFVLSITGRRQAQESRDASHVTASTAATASLPPEHDPSESGAPTAFISWAHGDSTWEQTIASLAFQLREHGVAADVDLFHLHDSDVEWSTYGVNAIERSDLILLAVSPAYKERWKGSHAATVGAGAAVEADAIQGLFAQENQAKFRRKLKIVVLPGASNDDIPIELLASAQRFSIPTVDKDGLEDLLRVIHNQPAFPAPPIGTVPVLPRKFLGATTESEGADELEPPPAELQKRLEELQAGLAALHSGDVEQQSRLATEHRTVEAAIQAVAAQPAQQTPTDLSSIAQPQIFGCTTTLLRHLREHRAQTARQLEQALGDVNQIGPSEVIEWTEWACANGTIEPTEGSSAVARWNITDTGQRVLGAP